MENEGATSPIHLDPLSAEVDDLLARMQTPHAKSALRDAFEASPEEFGRAAVAAANPKPA